MVLKRTLNVALLLALMMGTIAFGLTQAGTVAGQHDASPAAGADADEVANAVSAAPASIAENATILDNELDANGKFVVLREGTNAWHCSPDAPGTPGNDPWCYDTRGWPGHTRSWPARSRTPRCSGCRTCCRVAVMPATPIPSPPSRPRARSGWPRPACDVHCAGGDRPDRLHDRSPRRRALGDVGRTPYEHIMMPVVDAEHEE